jgi:hypothetical protein
VCEGVPLKSTVLFALSTFFTGGLVVFWGLVLNSWPHIKGFDQPESVFYDLQVLLFQAEQLSNGVASEVYFIDTSAGYVPNYPVLVPWILSSLSVGMGALVPIGISLALAFSAVTAMMWGWAIHDKGLGEKIVTIMLSLLLVFSPPTILAFERGNYDLLVFVLASLALALSSKLPVAGSALLSLTALMKLFPVGLALMFATQKNRLMLLSIPALSMLTYLVFGHLHYSQNSLKNPFEIRKSKAQL